MKAGSGFELPWPGCLGGEHFSTEHANNIKDVGTKQVENGSMSTIDHEFMDAGRGC